MEKKQEDSQHPARDLHPRLLGHQLPGSGPGLLGREAPPGFGDLLTSNEQSSK